MSKDEQDWLMPRDVMRIAGVTRATVRAWMRRDDAPKTQRTPAGHLRIHAADFHRWWAAQQERRA